MYSTLLSAASSLFPIGRCLGELHRTQWLTAKEIRALQLKRLRKILDHCYRTVPYHHKTMKQRGIRPEDFRSLDDLRRLPPVGKGEIRKNPELFRSRDTPMGVFEATTSGSTGEPFKFLRSKHTYEWEVAGALRQNGWTGYTLGDRWANIRVIRESGSVKEAFENAARDLLLRRLRVDHRRTNKERMRKGARRIASFKPFLVEAFPKILLEFGRFVQQENIGVPVVISTGEGTAHFERRLLADLWGGEVYDSYRSGEAMAASSECSEHSGLHISDELYVLEFVRDGEHVSPGEQGRILVTSLYHRAQPFIRYDIGDLSTPMDEECPCGRGLSLMSTVEGRYIDILETEAGELIFASVFTSWFSDMWVRQFQIGQRSRTKMIIRVVPDQGYTEESGSAIAARARAVLGANVEVGILVMDSIPDYESGKRQIVRSRVRFPAVT